MNLHGSTAAELRDHYLRWRFVPLAAELLRRDGVGSVTLAFAQFWNDEAHDAVHDGLFVSPSQTPGWPLEEVDWDTLSEAHRALCGRGHDEFYGDNYDLIHAFAAYCKPGCDQEMSSDEAYLPYAVAWLKDGQLQVDLVGELLHQGREDWPLLTHGPPPVGRAERVRGGALLTVGELLVATEADEHLSEAIEMASILIRTTHARLNRTKGDAKADKRVLAWLQAYGGAP